MTDDETSAGPRDADASTAVQGTAARRAETGHEVNPGVTIGPVGGVLVRRLGHYPKAGEIYSTGELLARLGE